MIEAVAIRAASASDRAVLTELSLRSKAYWAYDEAFMERVRPALTPDAEYLDSGLVFVALDGNGAPIGFYGFKDRDGEMFLEDLFVEPAFIGKGVGKALWSHALDRARERGWRAFQIESDPNAEPFYLRRGAVRVGNIRSSSGRLLPLLTVTL